MDLEARENLWMKIFRARNNFTKGQTILTDEEIDYLLALIPVKE